MTLCYDAINNLIRAAKLNMTNNKAFILTQTNGSIYHLGLHPGEVAPHILLVGDQDRVEIISQHFDSIEISQKKP